MRIDMRSFATGLAISATLLMAIPDSSARAAAPPPDTVGRMKRIVIPDDSPPPAATKPNKPPSQPANAASSAGPQAPILSNPVPAQVPVQSMINRSLRVGAPVVPSPLQ